MPRVTFTRRWMVALPFAALAGCATAPYTERSQLILVPESQEIRLGADAYHEVLRTAVLVHDPKVVTVVRRVGERIARVANQPNYRWEFAVIDDDSMINAFALPGGKVAVYTGIFEVAQDEAGLAAVIGHEVSHALAHHGAERMSQGVLAQIGAVGLATALGGGDPQTARLVMEAFGLGVQYGVLLPWSRAQESEADRIGLILMAKAGYDPHAALDLWERMEKINDKTPPEFLSTHPGYGTREAAISRWLPEAERFFRADPSVSNEKLPTRADLEAAADHGDAALKRYADTISSNASSPAGERLLLAALARTLELPAETIDRRHRDTAVNLGEVAVASALANAGAGSFDTVTRDYKLGKGWPAIAKEDDTIIKEALGLLRTALVEARRLAREQGQRRP